MDRDFVAIAQYPGALKSLPAAASSAQLLPTTLLAWRVSPFSLATR
jgi:hypothetical protein